MGPNYKSKGGERWEGKGGEGNGMEEGREGTFFLHFEL